MPGRPIKPRVAIDRKVVLDRLRADLDRFTAAAAREQAEREQGGPA